MCMQCMAGAMSAGAGATGLRSYLAARGGAWSTPRRMRRVTIALIVGALTASALIVTGPAPATATSATHRPAPTTR